ncbi:MAG: PTS transporter subunit EIIC [Clostridiales bacterium]|nr:PTS transporter subunit EIIC [Clostridiales bacterium]
MAKKDYTKSGEQILKLVGTKDNVSLLTHCITRLRFEVKDQSKVDEAEIKSTDGVIGTAWVGTQFQVIIGTDVEKYYDAICDMAGFERAAAIDENLDSDTAEKKKFDVKQIGNNIIKYISTSMVGILPLLIGASLVKALLVIFGPDLLDIISDTSGIYLMGDMIYDSCFYFLPMLLGYTAAKQLKVDPIYGLFVGGILIVPDFVTMVSEGTALSIAGLSVPMNSYGQTFLPVILGVWVLSYVNKLAKKISPKFLSVLLEPLLTVLIMAPIMFYICGPIGNWCGNILNSVFSYLGSGNIVLVIIADILLTVFFPYIVLCGMHLALLVTAIANFATTGTDSYILVAGFGYNFVLFGLAFGCFLKAKGEDKSYLGGATLTGVLGGVCEPIIYGCLLKYKGAMKAATIALAITGLYQGIFHLTGYCLPAMNNIFMIIPFFTGGSVTSMVTGIIYVALAFVLGTVCGWIFVKTDQLVESK